MRQINLARTLALLATVLLQGCAAILASNQPKRPGLIPQVREGMTRDQVHGVMGPPDETMAFHRTGTVSWDYRYTDTWGYLSLFSVIFDTRGVVASTVTFRLSDGGDSGLN